MSLSFYMDVHVPLAITRQLRRREVDILTAQEDRMETAPDDLLLDRASALGRILFTRDRDFLAEGVKRQRKNLYFSGIVYAHQLDVGIGLCVEDLELIAKCYLPEDLNNRIEHLPLRV